MSAPQAPAHSGSRSWMGTAAAVGGTNGGRRHEAIHGLSPRPLRTGGGHLADQANRALFSAAFSLLFARQPAITRAMKAVERNTVRPAPVETKTGAILRPPSSGRSSVPRRPPPARD